MIGYHDGRSADVDGPTGVFGGHDAFQAEFTAPAFTHVFGCPPVHRLVEHGREIIGNRDADIAALADVVLEV